MRENGDKLSRNWVLSRRHRARQAAGLMFALFICGVIWISQGHAQDPAGPAASIDFTRDIQPILAQSC